MTAQTLIPRVTLGLVVLGVEQCSSVKSERKMPVLCTSSGAERSANATKNAIMAENRAKGMDKLQSYL